MSKFWYLTWDFSPSVPHIYSWRTKILYPKTGIDVCSFPVPTLAFLTFGELYDHLRFDWVKLYRLTWSNLWRMNTSQTILTPLRGSYLENRIQIWNVLCCCGCVYVIWFLSLSCDILGIVNTLMILPYAQDNGNFAWEDNPNTCTVSLAFPDKNSTRSSNIDLRTVDIGISMHYLKNIKHLTYCYTSRTSCTKHPPNSDFSKLSKHVQ